MIMKRQNVFVKPKVRSPVIRFKVRHEWWDAGNSTESRGIKTTFDREWSECGRGPGVISLWLETSRQNKSESAAVSSDRAVMAVTAECDMMPGIVMSALICYDPPGQPLSLSSLFICFSPPHRGLAPGWGECTRVPLLLRKAHNCGSG